MISEILQLHYFSYMLLHGIELKKKEFSYEILKDTRIKQEYNTGWTL